MRDDEVTARREAKRREAEAAEAERREGQVRALREAQEQAREAIEQGPAGTRSELARLAEAVVEKLVQAIQGLKGALDRGVAFEAYAARDGYLDRPTLGTKFPIDPETITLLVKATRELARIGMVDWRLAEMRALQRASL